MVIHRLFFVKIAQIPKLKHILYVIINYYASFIEHVEVIGHVDSFMGKRLFEKRMETGYKNKR